MRRKEELQKKQKLLDNSKKKEVYLYNAFLKAKET